MRDKPGPRCEAETCTAVGTYGARLALTAKAQRGGHMRFVGSLRTKLVSWAFSGSSPGWRMWVTDESGATVCLLKFSGR